MADCWRVGMADEPAAAAAAAAVAVAEAAPVDTLFCEVEGMRMSLVPKLERSEMGLSWPSIIGGGAALVGKLLSRE